MRKAAALVLLATTATLLAGCGHHPGGIFGRARPDEFAVQRQAPLVVPPDFAIEPPKAGAPLPATTNTQQQTLESLFGPAQRSDVEKNTVGAAGRSTPGIRSAVGDPQTNTVAKGELTRDILAAPQGDGREAQTSAGS